MGGKDKGIFSVLDHAHHEPRHECLGCRVKVVQHRVDAPPAQDSDRVYVSAHHEEFHGPTDPHQAHDYVRGFTEI